MKLHEYLRRAFENADPKRRSMEQVRFLHHHEILDEEDWVYDSWRRVQRVSDCVRSRDGNEWLAPDQISMAAKIDSAKRRAREIIRWLRSWRSLWRNRDDIAWRYNMAVRIHLGSWRQVWLKIRIGLPVSSQWQKVAQCFRVLAKDIRNCYTR